MLQFIGSLVIGGLLLAIICSFLRLIIEAPLLGGAIVLCGVLPMALCLPPPLRSVLWNDFGVVSLYTIQGLYHLFALFGLMVCAFKMLQLEKQRCQGSSIRHSEQLLYIVVTGMGLAIYLIPRPVEGPEDLFVTIVIHVILTVFAVQKLTEWHRNHLQKNSDVSLA